MGRRETQKYLGRYRDAVIRRRTIKARLAQLEADRGSITVDLSGMPKGGSEAGKMELLVERIDAQRAELAAADAEMVAAQAEVGRAIDTVPDALQAQVLTLRYINLYPWQKVAALAHVSGDHVFYLHRQALDAVKILE